MARLTLTGIETISKPEPGQVVITRLHRMVRHGYRPWLGYDVASRQDQTIELHIKGAIATLAPDGTVALAAGTIIPGDDTAAFDTAFPPNAPNKRNLLRRLYEMGF